MFEFEVYSDDSATHPNSAIAIAACYIARKQQWDKFVKSWDALCKSEGLEYFHMAEFAAKPEAGHKPYCDWDNDRKDRVFAEIASIINRRAAQGIAVGVPKSEFERCAPPEFRKQYANNNYTFAVKVLMGAIGEWRAQYSLKLPMQYVFDQGSLGEDQIRHLWDIAARNQHVARKYGLAPNGYGFQDKKLFKPLQAADILAWQWQNHLRKSVFSGHPERGLHYNFEKLRKIPMRLGYYSDDQIVRAFEQFRQYEVDTGSQVYLS